VTYASPRNNGQKKGLPADMLQILPQTKGGETRRER